MIIRESAIDAFYKLTDSRAQITSYVFDEVRASVPKINLDDVFTSKEEIAGAIKEQLAKAMTGFGFSILQALITDIEPAAKVKAAMNEINAAQRMRLAAFQQAEADKIRVIKAAEADAESKFLAGQGIARQRQAIMAGLRESVTAFQGEVSDVTSRDVLSLMLLVQCENGGALDFSARRVDPYLYIVYIYITLPQLSAPLSTRRLRHAQGGGHLGQLVDDLHPERPGRRRVDELPDPRRRAPVAGDAALRRATCARRTLGAALYTSRAAPLRRVPLYLPRLHHVEPSRQPAACVAFTRRRARARALL